MGRAARDQKFHPANKNLPNPLFLWIMRALMVYPGAYNRRANFTLGTQNES